MPCSGAVGLSVACRCPRDTFQAKPKGSTTWGTVLGHVYLADGSKYACIWPYGASSPTFLTPNIPIPYNGITNPANVISNAGIVTSISRSDDVNQPVHAALWVNGVVYDLNDLLPPGDRYDPLTGHGWIWTRPLPSMTMVRLQGGAGSTVQLMRTC